MVREKEAAKGSLTQGKVNHWVAGILIGFLGFAVYANSLGGAFIWDDEYLVRDNPIIQDWANLPRIFTEDIGAGVGQQFTFYRPLQMLTYMLDYSVWELDPTGFHLTNILFHVAAALAVYYFIFTLYNEWKLALWAGILFVIHPIHTEAVAYISSRADPMFAFFTLLAAIFYLKNLSRQSLLFYLCMTMSYVCALLSKEMSLVLPVLLLLYHYAFSKKILWKPFLTLVGVAVAYLISRVTVFHFQTEGHEYTTTLIQRLPGFFVSIAEYLRLMLLPFHLHMEYGNKLFVFSDPRAVAGVVLCVLALSYAVVKRKEKGLVFFGLTWFFVALFPASNLYPINATMAEHWLYLPAIGLFLIAARGFDRLYSKDGTRLVALILFLGLTLFFSCLTISQNRYWKNQITFYERTLRYAPESIRMHNGLALAYYEAGDKDKAIQAFKNAIQVFPDSASMYNNLGALYMAMGQGDHARESFLRAVELDRDYGEPYGNLAIYYFRAKQYDLAIEYCDKAGQLGVANPKLLNDLKPFRNK